MSDRGSAAAAASPVGIVLKPEPHACFACGELNPIGLHLQLHVAPSGCWTELAIPEQFQGWEGVIHGGIITTILDEVLTWSLIERDSWGVTAKLNVEFKRPLLVGQLVRAEGWVVQDRRRLVTTAGRIVEVATGLELATAEGTFVTVPEAKKRELQARYGNLADARMAMREAAGNDGHPAVDGDGRPGPTHPKTTATKPITPTARMTAAAHPREE